MYIYLSNMHEIDLVWNYFLMSLTIAVYIFCFIAAAAGKKAGGHVATPHPSNQDGTKQ